MLINPSPPSSISWRTVKIKPKIYCNYVHNIVCTVFDDNRASYFIYKITSSHYKHSLFTHELAKHLCSRIENQQTQMDNSSNPLTDSDNANTALRAAPKTNACKNKKLLV